VSRLIAMAVGASSLALAVTVRAQALQWHPLPSSPAAAALVLWDHGGHECGAELAAAAPALLQCRLVRAKAAAPAVVAMLYVDGRRGAIVGTAPADAAAELVPFVQALLDDGTALAADAQALAVAHAALRIDDEQCVRPGGVLRHAARTALWPHRGPVPGDAVAIVAMPPARLGELLRLPVRRVVAAAGAPSASLPATLQAIAPAPAAAMRQPMPAAVPSHGELHDVVHTFTDQPFVLVGFPVPADADRTAVAVAVAAAHARAAQRWPLRGTELRSHAPFVSFEWLAGCDLVAFCRRGVDDVELLPGERAPGVDAERAAVAAEVRDFVADLRTRPLAAPEVEAARRARCLEITVVAPSPGDPSSLAARLLAATLAGECGIRQEAILAVAPAAAVQALQALLAGRGTWHAVSPLPVSQRGFRR
jgi:hypothetical protein